jgi:hypothetical protein
VKTVDNVDYFTLEGDPDTDFYESFKQIFGNDEFFVIAFKKNNLFSYDNLTLLKNLTEELESIQGIREVKSLGNVDDTLGEDDFFIVQKFLEDIPQEKNKLDKLKQRALSNPLYVDNFVSKDGQTAAIVIYVEDRPDEPEFRKKIIQECEKKLELYRQYTGIAYKAGWTTTNLYLSQFMKRDISVFIPISYLFIAVAVYFFFRNIWLTCMAVLNISICMGSTMGLFPILGITLNNVTTVVPPVVMALALCDTVHIFSHLNKELLEQFDNKEKALCHVLKKVVMPCFLTTLTTAVGFLSLYSNKLGPIKDFAIVASAGMAFEFIYAFLFLPSAILFLPSHKIFTVKLEDGSFRRFIESIYALVNKRHGLVCILSTIIVFGAVAYMLSIRVDTNVLNYFKQNSSVKTATNFVENNISGVRTIEISLTADGVEDAFKSPDYLRYIDTLQGSLQTIKGIDKAISFIDFLKDMNQSFHNENPDYLKIPESKPLIAQYLLLYGSDNIYDFINESFNRARISLRISCHGTAEQKHILEQLHRIIKLNYHPDISVRITGKVVQDIKMIDTLVDGQIYSLAIATAVIAVLMFFVMKSIKLGLISIIPNFFPIILNFGIMGLLGIPLNAATSLIAAVALGIAVDDTIHFLTAFKRHAKGKHDIPQAIHATIMEKGRALFASSLILSIGFVIMVLSSFVPTIYFGLLSSIIMVSAAIGDALILPALMMTLTKFKLFGETYETV